MSYRDGEDVVVKRAAKRPRRGAKREREAKRASGRELAVLTYARFFAAIAEGRAKRAAEKRCRR